MGKRERAKGVRGELEVRDIFRAAGLPCERTPNSGGLMLKGDLLGDVPAHLEVKWQETARPWLWWEQATADAPAGVMPVVAFRRSRSPWLALVRLDQLADLLAAHPFAGDAARRTIADTTCGACGPDRCGCEPDPDAGPTTC